MKELKFYKEEPNLVFKALRYTYGNTVWVLPAVANMALGASEWGYIGTYGILGVLMIHSVVREKVMFLDSVFRDSWKRYRESVEISALLRETLKNAKLVHVEKVEKTDTSGKKKVEEIVKFPVCRIQKDQVNYYLTFRIRPGQTEEEWERKASAFSSAIAGTMVDYEIAEGIVKMTIQHTPLKADRVLYKSDNGHYLNVGVAPGKVVKWNFDDDPHGLIVGTTGSGKSTFVRNLLVQFDPEWEVYVCDGKYVEFSFLRDYGFKVASDEKGFADFIDRAHEEVIRRNREMERAGVNDYKLLNWKPYFLVIDEFIFVADSFSSAKGKGVAESDRDKMFKKLRHIALMGRACGVQLILILQRPDASYLPTVIRDNMVLKVCLMKGRSQTALEMCFGAERAKELRALKPGMGYMETGEGFSVFGFANYPQGQFREDLKFRKQETPPRLEVLSGAGSPVEDRKEA